MKKITITLLISLIWSATTLANDVIMSQKTVKIPVDISTTKLKWSQADYSSPVVKVLVPALAAVTLLDHRNTGEGAPCLASYEANTPEEVIQNNPQTEQIEFTVTLIKQVIPDLENNRCLVHLIENVDGKIRGFEFTHQRDLQVGHRHIDDCQ